MFISILTAFVTEVLLTDCHVISSLTSATSIYLNLLFLDLYLRLISGISNEYV